MHAVIIDEWVQRRGGGAGNKYVGNRNRSDIEFVRYMYGADDLANGTHT